MRICAQFLALAIALGALIGLGALTTTSMRSLELKQQRALDADIDWIVAQRRREIAKAQAATPPARADTDGMRAREQTAAQPGDQREAESRDRDEARAAMAQARKNAAKRPRNAARRHPLLPHGFGRLPLFTVETLLGIR